MRPSQLRIRGARRLRPAVQAQVVGPPAEDRVQLLVFGLALLNTGDRAGAKGALQSYVDNEPNAPDASQMKALIKALG